MDKSSVLTCTGLVLVLCGLSLFCTKDMLFRTFLAKETELAPGSLSYEMWRDPSLPLILKFYFFNWTNTEELYDEGFKPKLVEVGPYTFREYFRKVNITWNENNTISYRRQKTWHFQPDLSVGQLTDNITTLNPVALSGSHVLRYRHFLMKLSLSSALKMSGAKVWTTRTAGEFLYDGYSDPLLTMASKTVFMSGEGPGDKFAWFYKRNGTSHYDGAFNMDTGALDPSSVGILREWNYRNRTDYFRGECGVVGGSDGAFFPPGLKRGEPIHMFSPDLCKSIQFDFLDEVEILGVRGFRYEANSLMMDSGTLDPANWCNCNGECVPYGVMNITACKFGAPAFVSYPHFLYADPFYLNQVEGLEPHPDRHRFYIILEPTTGLPMDVAARFQVNMLLEPSSSIFLYNDVPRIFFPMMWFEETVTLSVDLAYGLRIMLALPAMALVVSVMIVLGGFTIIGFALMQKYVIRKSRNEFHFSATSAPQGKDGAPASTEEVVLLERKQPVTIVK